MEELLKILVSVLGTIIVAGGSVVIAYFNKLKRKLDEANAEKKKKDTQIQNLHNGFREYVYKELQAVNKKMSSYKCHNCHKEIDSGKNSK